MANDTASPVKIKYGSLEEGSIKEMEDLLAECFVPDDILLRLCRNCQGSQPEHHRSWVEKIVHTHDWSVSRLALDSDTGRVVGLCLCDVETSDNYSKAMDAFGRPFTQAISLSFGFFGELVKDYDIFKALGVKKVMHLNFVVVDKRYRRQGISFELRRQSLELARQHGCKAVKDNAVSPYTRRALAKLGFKQERFLPFTESLLKDVDEMDLSACGPEDGCALMVCRL